MAGTARDSVIEYREFNQTVRESIGPGGRTISVDVNVLVGGRTEGNGLELIQPSDGGSHTEWSATFLVRSYGNGPGET
jgi:hypothetical protein